jgi:hypothetical protein
MATVSKCLTIVRGRTLRVTALDECGRVYSEAGTPPACEVVVTDGIVSVAVNGEYEAGDDIRDKNWAGVIAVEDRSLDQFVRYSLTATFLKVDPALVSLITGLPVELDADSEIAGFRTRAGVTAGNVAIEFWTGVSPIDCGALDVPYGYTLFPWVRGGRLGNLTIQNGRADFVIEGMFSGGGGGWGVGPYDVVLDGLDAPAPLAVAMAAEDHHLFRETRVAPPAAACTCYSLTEAGGTRPAGTT